MGGFARRGMAASPAAHRIMTRHPSGGARILGDAPRPWRRHPGAGLRFSRRLARSRAARRPWERGDHRVDDFGRRRPIGGFAAASSSLLPLEGLRVVELVDGMGWPIAGRVLGFLGADSIHVKSPNRVNSWRLNKEAPNPINFPGRQPGDRPFDRSFLFDSPNSTSCTAARPEDGRGGAAAQARRMSDI